MLDIPAIREAASERQRIRLDPDGALDLSGDTPSWDDRAVLVVDEVTEAVKRVEGESVLGSVDRDELWAVKGIILDREVALALPDDLGSPADLIEAVTNAGYHWTTVRATSSSP